MRKIWVDNIVVKAFYEIEKLPKKNLIKLVLLALISSGLSLIELDGYQTLNLIVDLLSYLLYGLFIYFCHFLYFTKKNIDILPWRISWNNFFRFVANILFIIAFVSISYIFIDWVLINYLFSAQETDQLKYSMMIFLCMVFPAVISARCSIFLPVIVSKSSLSLERAFSATKGYIFSLVFIVWVFPFFVGGLVVSIPDIHIVTSTLKLLIEYFCVFFGVTMLCTIYKDISFIKNHNVD